MTDLAALQAKVHGRVQGVYFRDFTARQAAALGLTGYVRNLPDGKTLEVQAEGEKNKLEKLVSHLQVGPPAAKVERLVTEWSEYTGDYTDFTVRY